MTNDTYYAACDWCGAAIAYGNAMTSVSRSIEQIDRSDEVPDGVVTVVSSETLLQLCAACGNRIHAGKLEKALQASDFRMGASPTSTLELLKAFCRESSISFFEQEETSSLSISITGENGQWNCLATDMGDERFGFFSFCPIKVPVAKRMAVSEYLTRANYGLWTGCFEVDFADGEVRFRTSGVGRDAIAPMFHSALAIMDQYLPGILEVIYSEKLAQEVLATIENA